MAQLSNNVTATTDPTTAASPACSQHISQMDGAVARLSEDLAAADAARALERIAAAAGRVAASVDMPAVPTGMEAFGHIRGLSALLSASLVGSIKQVTDTLPILSPSVCRQVQEACEALLRAWPATTRQTHARNLSALQSVKRALRDLEPALSAAPQAYAAAATAIEDAVQRLHLLLQLAQPWEYSVVERCARRARSRVRVAVS